MAELTTQNAVEVLGAGDPEVRVTQNAVEVFGSAVPDIRTTQNAVEVLGTSNPDIRVTQTAVEVFGSANPNARVTQIAIEVLAPVPAPPPPEPEFGYGHNFAFHRFHDTGPTNNSIPHDTPLNQYTTGQGIGMRRKSILAAAMGQLPPPPPSVGPFCNSLFTQIVIYDPITSGASGTITVPAGATRMIAKVWARGGGGEDGDTSGGNGGGGGGYAGSVFPVVPGELIGYNIDASSTNVLGLYGSADANAGQNGGSGGAGGEGFGDVTLDGEDGGIAGEGAGADGGQGATGGTGGLGGNDISVPGQDGGYYGGGGGGGFGSGDPQENSLGGIGGAGLIVLQFCPGYGYRGDIHQSHNTGQTTGSITHDTPLNQWTTTKGIGLRRKWILGAAISAGDDQIPVPLPPFCGITVEDNEILSINGRLRRFESVTFIASGSFTIPANVYSIYVECIGAGGGGGNGNSGEDEDGGSGGGGGAYAASLISVLPGNAFNIGIGVGGPGEGFDGGATDFDSGQVYADYGRYGTTVAGAGGLAANCVGQVTISGGNGFTSIQASPVPVGGATGGTAAGGGSGGIPGNPNSAGGPGQYPGAGGGGGGSTLGPGGGGTGADGLVRITWMTYDYGFTGGPNRYPSRRHQTHSTGQTNWSIPHCNPLNQWTTTKGISLRNKYLYGEEGPPPPPPVALPTYTNIRACRCPQFAPPPPPPMNFFGGEGGDENIELSWMPNPQALCYNIYRGTESGGETLLAECVETPYLDAPIVCGVTYYYYITSVSGVGEGPPSPEIVVTTVNLPDPPADFAAEQLDQLNTELTWTADPDADYYSIYRGTTSGGETIFATPVTGTSYNDGNRLCGNTYYYYITSVNECGESDPSPEIQHDPCCDWSDCCGCVPATLDVEVNELYGCPVTGTATFDSGDQEYNFSQSNCQGAVSFIAYCTGGNWFVDVIQSGEGGPSPVNTYPLTGTCSPFNMSTVSSAFDGGPYGPSTIQINLTEP